MKRDHLLCGVLLIICLHAPNQGSRDRRDALSYRIACRYNLLEICSRAHLPNMLTRRGFLTTAALGLALGGFGCHGLISGPRRRHAGTNRIFFVSQGRTALINADGSGLRYLRLDAPNQVTWQPADFFTDGRRILFLSMEPRRDGPGRPFDEYYTQTPTHLWIYDLDSGSLKEIATRDRLAVFYTPQLLLNDERMLVQVVRNKIGQIFSMNLDGTDQREFTRSGEGLPYGFDLSPDQQTVAFHLASPAGYQIWTSDLEGRNRTLIAAHRDRLYFGPVWSPDGQWLAYQSCHFREDPAHDWSDVCVSRPNGSGHRVLTNGQSHWFGASYGHPQNRGSGSNMLAWTHDSQILFSRKLPGSKVPWEYQTLRTDTDHFNREFKPSLARGGTEICRLNPADGSVARLTRCDPPRWDFRASESPDGEKVLFCRSAVGTMPSVWVIDSNGRNAKQLTHGLNDRGADHPQWLPVTTANLYYRRRSASAAIESPQVTLQQNQ